LRRTRLQARKRQEQNSKTANSDAEEKTAKKGTDTGQITIELYLYCLYQLITVLYQYPQRY
jgi:hypothetical protein